MLNAQCALRNGGVISTAETLTRFKECRNFGTITELRGEAAARLVLSLSPISTMVRGRR
jgi:hypothetical protein